MAVVVSPLPDISVVVSTCNRARELETALPALLAQDLEPDRYEVIVVNNNAVDDGTAEVVRRFQSAHAPHLRYAAELKPGASHGRNRGILAARAPIIAITDDDAEVAPGWLRRILESFARHPEAAFVGGRVKPRWPVGPPRWVTEAQWGPLALVDYGDDLLVLGVERPLCLLTANFAVRRSAIERAGLFAPEFRRCQDHELQFRMWQLGLTGLYDPAVVVWTSVAPERLRKAYHRMWYRRNGAYHALMPSRALLDRPLPPHEKIVSLWGVPAFVYRQVISEAMHAVASYAAGREARAFAHETRIWYFLSYMRARIAQHRRLEPSWLAGDFVRFVLELARAKTLGGARRRGAPASTPLAGRFRP